eukprot:6054920-Pyramimonas_sp.AAC.1
MTARTVKSRCRGGIMCKTLCGIQLGQVIVQTRSSPLVDYRIVETSMCIVVGEWLLVCSFGVVADRQTCK